MVVKTYNLSTQEVEMEMGGSKVQGHPQLCIEFDASVGYMRPCLRKT